MSKSIGNGFSTKFWLDDWLNDNGSLIDFINNPHSLDDLNITVAAMYVKGINSITHLVPEHIFLQVQAHLPPSPHAPPDKPIRKHTPTGLFSLSSAIRLLTDKEGMENEMECPNVWKRIWKWSGPQWVCTFLWLAAKGKLLTNFQRFKRHLAPSSFCCRCNNSNETSLHALRDCPEAVKVWRDVLPR